MLAYKQVETDKAVAAMPSKCIWKVWLQSKTLKDIK